MWTIVQLLESGDPTLTSNIRNSNLLIPHIRALSQSPPTSASSSVGSRSHHTLSQSYDDTEHGEGAGEIATLAKRILEFAEGDAEVFNPVGQLHRDEDSDDDGHLRRSVHEALGSSAGHDGHY